MRILVAFRADFGPDGTPVPAYPWSYVEELRALGHEVVVNQFDIFCDYALEIENGRDEKGELRFQLAEGGSFPECGVLLYDSHGHPDLHQAISQSYDHVFFGSWCKRDLFAGHPSAHWCPSATDLKWFGAERFAHITPEVDFGFFGSKKGLSRAEDLIAICKRNGWSYDVRQVAGNRNSNRWPATGEAMARCRVLFNRGQKHDGPNLRVMESMAVGRPLVCDYDPQDGMTKLFEMVSHYRPYGSIRELEQELWSCLVDTSAKAMAYGAQGEVEAKHLVKHRVAQILEVIGA